MSYCNRFGLKQKHGHFGSVLFVHYSNDIGLRLTVRTATLPLETCWGDFHEIVSDRRCDTRLSGARSLGPGIGRAETHPFSCYLIALFQVHFRVSCLSSINLFLKTCTSPAGQMTKSNPAGNRSGPQVTNIFQKRALRQPLPHRQTPRLGS